MYKNHNKKETLMKKSTLLTALLVVPMGIAIAQQGGERSAPYQMIDAVISRSPASPDWPAIFAILDRMQGVINVNEYRTKGSAGLTLLGLALLGRNPSFLVVKTLLEKYKADPNVPANLKGDMPSADKSDTSVNNLLRQYGARGVK
jgi:hypothetical protein